MHVLLEGGENLRLHTPMVPQVLGRGLKCGFGSWLVSEKALSLGRTPLLRTCVRLVLGRRVLLQAERSQKGHVE